MNVVSFRSARLTEGRRDSVVGERNKEPRESVVCERSKEPRASVVAGLDKKLEGPLSFELLPVRGNTRSTSMTRSTMPAITSSGAIRRQSAAVTKYVNVIEPPARAPARDAPTMIPGPGPKALT